MVDDVIEERKTERRGGSEKWEFARKKNIQDSEEKTGKGGKRIMRKETKKEIERIEENEGGKEFSKRRENEREAKENNKEKGKKKRNGEWYIENENMDMEYMEKER